MPRNTHQNPRAPELLAPVGGPDALRAAVANGADAVYLGAGDFNARRNAQNFTLEELEGATRYAHLRGVKVYLTANILVLPSEMSDALRLIDDAWSAGVDAVITQDLGLMQLIAYQLPAVRMHASTQLNTHDSATAAELAGLGVSRVTLSREMSIDRISRLAHTIDIETEAFVHGALCFCYSGQCLLSSMIGGRSGNRGLCAQPCRLRYELRDAEGDRVETPGPYVLSPKDIAGIEVLPALIASGVAALKIEGRMKSPEYAALVTGVYRGALDRALADPDEYRVTDAERNTLDEAFTRGFSSAYLEGIDDDRMMSYTRPNNRGVRVGRVAGVSRGTASLALDTALDAEDTIEVWTSSGRVTQRVGPMHTEAGSVRNAPGGATVEIDVERPVRTGDRVFRVVNESLMTAARRTYSESAEVPRVGVEVAVRAVEDAPVRIDVRAGEYTAAAEGAAVERARTKALTADEIVEHVGRMGATPFEPAAWDIELQPGVGMGFSVLHRVRTEALEGLERAMLKRWERRPLAVEIPTRPPMPPTSAEVKVAVRAFEGCAVQVALDAGADEVLVPLTGEAVSRYAGEPRVTFELPRVAYDDEMGAPLDRIARGMRVVAPTLGLLAGARDRGAEVEAGWPLNVTNAWSAHVLAELGASFIWLSPELRGEQIAEVTSSVEVPTGSAIFGRQELMLTQHCVLSVGGCSRECESCARRSGFHEIVDDKGYAFPVASDRMGRSHIFNSVPLDLQHAAGDLAAAGIAAVRVDLTTEAEDEIGQIVSSVLHAVKSGGAERDDAHATTTGHFFRGVE